MNSNQALLTLLFGIMALRTGAFPTGHDRNNTTSQRNDTITLMQISNDVSADKVVKSLSSSAVIVLQDCMKLQQNLADNLPTDFSDVSIPFPQLQLDQISCRPFQIVQRVQKYLELLMRFSNPLSAMLRETGISIIQRRLLMKLSNSMTWLNVHHINMLEIFEAKQMDNTMSPSILQLDNATRLYLTKYFPNSNLSKDQMNKVRTSAFLKAIMHVVETIKLEMGLAMPFLATQ